MEQKVSSSYYYKVLLLTCNCVCVSVCNLHVNCVSFVCCCCCVVKIDWFSRGKKAWIFSRHNFRKQQKGKKILKKKNKSHVTVLHKRKKLIKFFSSWRRVLPPRTTPRSRRYSSRYITKIEVCATLRALLLSFYFSLSRPRRTAEIIDDAFLRLDYISDWQTLLFSLSAFINIIKITDAWRFPI
jgi:hypothetical protein